MTEFTITPAVTRATLAICASLVANSRERAVYTGARSLERRAARWAAYFAAETGCVGMNIPADSFPGVQTRIIESALMRERYGTA